MLKFEPGLIIWTIVSFSILLILLYKLVLPPLLKFLSDREKLISDSISKVAENQKKSEDLLTAQKKQLEESRKHADEIIERARSEAEMHKQEIIENARKQSDIVLNQARKDINQEREKVFADLKEEVADMVISASSKLLSRVITIEDHRKIAEESLREVIDERN